MALHSFQDLLSSILERSYNRRRFITAVAGPPGAGKSTLSQTLAKALPSGTAAVLQADGFHYDNALLAQLGRENRKGAPDTFDCPGFGIILKRLRDREPDVIIPAFDRTRDVSVAGAAMIAADIKHIIVEGNYLALSDGPWSELRRHFDATVLIDVPREELERRLLRRWIDLGRSFTAARQWVDGNDMPNVDLVVSQSRMADTILFKAGHADGIV